jgi:fructokinase
LQPDSQHRIGVDLGGTKIEAVVIALDPSGDAGERPLEVARSRVPTDRGLGYDHVLAQTRGLVQEVAERAGIDLRTTPVGVGMPGATTHRRADGSRSPLPLVKNSNTTCLNGRPFHDDLSRALALPIRFANDANCFALAEATWGAAAGASLAFGVILGTGVGGGVVIGGPDASRRRPWVWDGIQGIAGEWGHIPLEPERGPACYCGRRGCVETYLAGPAIEAAYRERAGLRSDGPGVPLAEIARRARGGHGVAEDRIARDFLAERVEIFGRALAIVVDVLDPDVVVLGGGVSNLEVFYEAGPAAVAAWVFNDELRTRIVKHALGDSAGVLGAALLGR